TPEITAYGGGIAFAFGKSAKASIGAAVARNVIADTTRAWVGGFREEAGAALPDVGTTVVSAPTGDVDAQTTATIDVIAAAGSGSSKFAVGGAGTLNDVTSETQARVGSSADVGGTSVNVHAADTSTIQSLTGALAVAKEGAIGGSVNRNVIGTTTRASVQD